MTDRIRIIKLSPAVEASRFEFRTAAKASTSIGMTYQLADLGRTYWIVKPRWRRLKAAARQLGIGAALMPGRCSKTHKWGRTDTFESTNG